MARGRGQRHAGGRNCLSARLISDKMAGAITRIGISNGTRSGRVSSPTARRGVASRARRRHHCHRHRHRRRRRLRRGHSECFSPPPVRPPEEFATNGVHPRCTPPATCPRPPPITSATPGRPLAVANAPTVGTLAVAPTTTLNREAPRSRGRAVRSAVWMIFQTRQRARETDSSSPRLYESVEKRSTENEDSRSEKSAVRGPAAARRRSGGVATCITC